MKTTTRRRFSPDFKAKVALEAVKEQRTIEDLSKRFDLHPTQVNAWKREFIANAASAFVKEGGRADKAQEGLMQTLYSQIGELKVANDFLKKSYNHEPR